eukprot:CAMPEP_0183510590 /NCGR_PEP_ID=MMETSP0371-20130417/10408_1 /TAXON_ID=268820 /ORGANISM="Peridinium aciculiferum, Strain PAER-2" /LENGTH=93 /DNA_ID=CAMNT_0025707429 /DNA_START=140 /DNA_END=419 /DNA_ORIENTATION=-
MPLLYGRAAELASSGLQGTVIDMIIAFLPRLRKVVVVIGFVLFCAVGAGATLVVEELEESPSEEMPGEPSDELPDELPKELLSTNRGQAAKLE